jgi:hypothetical protein
MNLGDVLDFINFIINKEQSGKFISPREFTLMLRHANYKFFKKYFDVPEEYQVGQPLSRIQWEITAVAKKKLRRFMVALDSTGVSIDSEGFFTIPLDMFFYDFFSSTTGVGRFVKGYEFDSILHNSITFPTQKRPIATIKGLEVKFAPADIIIDTFNYLRYPEEPNFDFYVDVNDNVIYLEPGQTSPPTGTPPSHLSESVELDWDVECIWDIIQYILEDVGLGINRAEVIQYANNRQTTGT